VTYVLLAYASAAEGALYVFRCEIKCDGTNGNAMVRVFGFAMFLGLATLLCAYGFAS
jgi:hypothetical protein